ncbi:DUF1996 domain-containing protein [Streptomyces sp. NPDC048277]|uniref:DUF1996 domain-containing protein n=1 Tax=Streptomyces sp. NPDC048277 TaxID=3155027 RepID=UPI0033E9D6F1
MWTRLFRSRARLVRILLPAAVGVSAVLGAGLIATGKPAVAQTAPAADRYTGIASVPRSALPAIEPDASTGTWSEDCGRNENGHRNADNLVVSPGGRGSAHHIHDYVGNVATTYLSSNSELAAARTTCVGGDRSTYYWPVLRRLDRMGTDVHAVGGGLDDNMGQILTPSSVVIEFRGNPVSKVVAMPRFLRLVTGDPVALYTDGANIRAQWGCSGFRDRFTTDYTLCPRGSGPTRTLDFPSCWDGLSTDSPDHRTHVVFPTADGVCPHATFAIPQLRVTLAYTVPPGVPYAVDSFPEEKRDPRTDHGMFIDVMTDRQMSQLVGCLNDGRHCRAS